MYVELVKRTSVSFAKHIYLLCLISTGCKVLAQTFQCDLRESHQSCWERGGEGLTW
jgi:hypothetical protein